MNQRERGVSSVVLIVIIVVAAVSVGATAYIYLRPQAEFQVKNLSLPQDKIAKGDTVTAQVEVTNTGDVEGTHTVEMEVEGETLTKEVTLNAGESRTVNFSITKQDKGTYDLNVEDLSESFEVVEAAEFRVSNLSISPSLVGEGDTVTLTVEVTNTGGITGKKTLEFEINRITETTEVTVEPEETVSSSTTVTIEEKGNYEVSIEGLLGTFEVLKPAEFEAVRKNGEVSEIGIQYLDRFPLEVLQNVSQLRKSTERNVSFVDNLLSLPVNVQTELAEEYAADGEISRGELNQANFLNTVKNRDELDYLLRNFDPTDKNVSNDPYTNYFSVEHSDIIDWDVANERNVLLLSRTEDIGFTDNFYKEKMKVPKDQRWWLLDEEATYKKFKELTDNLEGKVDKNDILIFDFFGHGAREFFKFHDTWASYESIANELNRLPSYQIVMVNSCFSGSALPELERENRVTLTCADENSTSGGLLSFYLYIYTVMGKMEVHLCDRRLDGMSWTYYISPDLNDSGFVSLGEAFETYRGLRVTLEMTPKDYVQTLKKENVLEETEEGYIDPDSQNPQMTDPSGIAYDLFLGQYLVENKKLDTEYYTNPW